MRPTPVRRPATTGARTLRHAMATVATAAACLIGAVAVVGVTTVASAPPAAAEFVSTVDVTFGSGPKDIVAGPDGNLWFTQYAANRIGRLTPSGVVTDFSVGIPPGFAPYRIAAGPDGNLWFTSASNNSIGRITPAGAVTVFSAGISGGASLDGIAAGPDGNLWFTEFNLNKIGRITPGGTVTEFTVGLSPNAGPSGIAAGPDGNLWFTEYVGNRIGRITPAGVVTEFATGLTAASSPLAIVAGADGSMWFTEYEAHRIGQITMNGLIFETVLPSATAKPVDIAAGPDGNVWFAEQTTEYVGRIDPAGAVTEFNGGPANSQVSGIATGSDGRVYFTEYNQDRVGIVDQLDGSPFVPVSPTRLLDSRTANGGWNGTLAAGAPRSLDVTGIGGIPEWATTVVMNVTVTGSDAPSFLTVYPDGTAPPNASNLNFAAGETIANHVTVRTGQGGRIAFATAVGHTHVVADIVGYYETGGTAGNRFTSLTPARILDSRTAVGGWNAKLGTGAGDQGRELMVTNVGGVSATAKAVVLNVTVTNGDAGSFLSVWPGGQTRPISSSINFGPGQTIANLVTVPVGVGGLVNFYNAVGHTDVVVDVVGYFDPAAGNYYHALRGPTRVLDDRVGVGLSGPWGPNQSRFVNVLSNTNGPTGIPAFAKGIVLNMTVTNATQGSVVTAYPPDVSPSGSSINFGRGQTIPNQVMVRLPTGGSFVGIYNELGSVDIIADATGYFAVD